MAAKTQQLWHTSEMFGPYRFFNVSRGQETSASSGSSLLNRNECQVAAALYNRLQKEFTSVDFDFRVGVVSMYRAQIQELRRTFQARFGADIVNKVDFNTVDGFQGQEKDIIILSCVRATTGGKSVGFLAGQHSPPLISAGLNSYFFRSSAHERRSNTRTFFSFYPRPCSHAGAQRRYMERHR